MPQAKIKINAVIGSNTDLPVTGTIPNIVQLDNQNIGGETTFNWTIVDKPPGSLSVLSSAIIQNPTFTPDVEGTYLIKLVVNIATGTEQTDQVVAAVRHFKTRDRIPAAGETTEGDASDGWAHALGYGLIRRVDSLYSGEYGIAVGVAGAAGIARGNVVRASATAIIKSGLPGQETVPSFTKALANVGADLNELLGVVEGGIDGNPSPASGALIRVRIFGMFTSGPAGSAGAPVYVTDSGTLSTTQGTNRRAIGSLASSGIAWINGSATFTFDAQFSTIIGGPAAAPVDLTNGATLSGTNAGINFTASANQSISKSGTGTLTVGTNLSSNLVFKTNAIDRWMVAAAGSLQSVGGPRPINGVSSPGTGTDAANKDYVDDFAKVPMFFGNATTPTGATTAFLDPGFSDRQAPTTEAKITMPTNCTARNMYVRARVGPVGNTQTITIRKNGAVDTALQVALAAGNTTGSDLTGLVIFTAGDDLSVQCAGVPGVTTGAIDLVVSFELVQA